MARKRFDVAVVLLPLVTVFLGLVSTSSPARVLAINQPESAFIKANNEAVENQEEYDEEAASNESTPNANTCYMDLEYKVMKRVAGRCTKLGRTTRGCVAGNYLHPFHPDCL